MQFVDTTKFTGSLAYADVDSSQGFWMFTADGYSIGTTKSTTSLTGIADTGTTLMLIDDSIVTAYYKKVSGAKLDNSQGGYTFPCKATLPDFTLTIGGQARTGEYSYLP
jgi:aspergillopepsin I